MADVAHVPDLGEWPSAPYDGSSQGSEIPRRTSWLNSHSRGGMPCAIGYEGRACCAFRPSRRHAKPPGERAVPEQPEAVRARVLELFIDKRRLAARVRGGRDWQHGRVDQRLERTGPHLAQLGAERTV